MACGLVDSAATNVDAGGDVGAARAAVRVPNVPTVRRGIGVEASDSTAANRCSEGLVAAVKQPRTDISGPVFDQARQAGPEVPVRDKLEPSRA